MSETMHVIKKILGIDNTSDLAANRLRKDGIYFYSMNNMDIDDEGKGHRRDGFGSAVASGTTIRSLWANKDICLFLDGTDFKRLNAGYTTSILVDGLSANDRFCYAENGNRVYFSNTEIAGYVDVTTGLPYPFSVPTENHKVRMVGGQVLEFYNSRLFAAHGSNLFFSDATIPTRMDQRKNAIAFKSRIRMVKAVDDGIYVSDSDRVYFEYGKSPISEFIEIPKLDSPAIEGMSASCFRKDKPTEKIAYWLAADGHVYAGHNKGEVTRVQKGLYQKTGLTFGSAIVRNSPFQQLLMIGR